MAEPKVALITDTHFGVRKGSQIFHDYYEKFYRDTFFPSLDEQGITTVIHLGDCFDVRKGIDYWSLDWARRVFFNPLKERGIEVHMIVGNHDIFYKNTLKINSPKLNLQDYPNVHVYDTFQDLEVFGTKVFLVPWICEENAEDFIKARDRSKAKIVMGHLELAGFYANKTYQCMTGMAHETFDKFDTVFTGHFHKRSKSGNIVYLGNPYQLCWNDEGETRGFHIWEPITGELEFIPNPNYMFHKIMYRPDKLINCNKAKNCYVKVVVEEKSTPQKLSAFIDNLYKVGVHDIKVIDSIDVSIDDDVEVEAEDTLTTLTNYVNAMEDTHNKDQIIDIFKSLYVEAQEV